LSEGPDPDRIRTRTEFGEELTKLREAAELTVRELASRSGIPPATVGGYLRARHLPSVGQLDTFRTLLAACGVSDEPAVDRWVAALARVRATSDGRIAHVVSPYPGLASFRTEDAVAFFGRDRAIAMLVDALRRSATSRSGPLLALVGPSGSGKSSLLRAGLVPAITSGALDGEPAECAVIHPGPDPRAAVHDALSAAPRVLIIDQFEELFTQCPDDVVRLQVLEAVTALDPARTLVIAGLRADFYSAAAREPLLVSALQNAQIVLAPMTRDELLAAITGPARQVGATIEDALVDLLLNELAPRAGTDDAHAPGALPLLSHALLATWNHARRKELTVADYLAVGGLNGAIQQSAEGVYLSLTPADQQIAHGLFLRLATAEGAVATRRRLAGAELEALTAPDTAEAVATSTVLDRFVEGRLLTAGADSVEVSHESLLWAWPRLRDWLDEDREGLRRHRQLTEASTVWEASNRDPSAVLRGSRLEAAVEWAAELEHFASLNKSEREFLDTSTSARDAELRAQRRHTRRLQQLLAGMAALFVIACLLAAYGLHARSTANTERSAANRARDQALSRQIALQVDKLRTTDPALAGQLAVAAYRLAPTDQATAALLQTTSLPDATRILGPAGPMQAVAVSPQRSLLATTAADGEVHLWQLNPAGSPSPLTTLAVQPPTGNPSTLFAVAFSPDGSLLATAGAAKTVQLWDVARPRHTTRLATLDGPTNTVYSLAFSPDGTTLAAGSADDRVHRWRLDASAPAHPLPALTGPQGYVQSIAFSPNGTQLAAGTASGDVDFWDMTSAHSTPQFVEHTDAHNAVFSVAYSPDGRTLAAGGQDGTIRRWTLPDGNRPRALASLSGFGSWVNGIAFSSDGSLIAGGGSDDSVRIWSSRTATLQRVITAPGPVTAIRFLHDDARLVGTTNNGEAVIWPVVSPVLQTDGRVFTVQYDADGGRMTVGLGSMPAQLWDTSGPQPRLLSTALTTPDPSITLNGTAALSPDGRLLAAGTSQGPVVIWDVSDPKAPKLLHTLHGPKMSDELVTFSPDGQFLAVSSNDTTVHMWNVSNPSAPTAMPTLAGAGGYVFNISFSPDGKLLAAPEVDNRVELWDLRDPLHPRRTAVLRGYTNYVYATAFTPDGHTLAAASADKTVRLYDLRDPASPRLIKTLTGPADYLLSAAISPDGTLLAAGGLDGAVWLWNIGDPRHPVRITQVPTATGGIYSLTFAPHGDMIAAGSADGSVHLLATDPAAVTRQICDTSGAAITRAEWKLYVPGAPYAPPCH
jgi:WD40 repeat protein/transcriptional regulator with XRE-family HTH domain